MLKRQVLNGTHEIDVLKWISRAALEYIGQAGLGYSFDALDEDKTNVYSDAAKSLAYGLHCNAKFGLCGADQRLLYRPTGSGMVIFQLLIPHIVKCGPPRFRRKLMEWAPSSSVQTLRRIVDIMDLTSKDIYRKKKQALADGDKATLEQVGQGKDIMSILRTLYVHLNLRSSLIC